MYIILDNRSIHFIQNQFVVLKDQWSVRLRVVKLLVAKGNCCSCKKLLGSCHCRRTPLEVRKAQSFSIIPRTFFKKHSHKRVETPKGFVLGRTCLLVLNVRLLFLRLSKTQYSSERTSKMLVEKKMNFWKKVLMQKHIEWGILSLARYCMLPWKKTTFLAQFPGNLSFLIIKIWKQG